MLISVWIAARIENKSQLITNHAERFWNVFKKFKLVNNYKLFTKNKDKINLMNNFISMVGKNLAKNKLSPIISNDLQEQNSSIFTHIYQITSTVCEISVDDSKLKDQWSRWYFLNGSQTQRRWIDSFFTKSYQEECELLKSKFSKFCKIAGKVSWIHKKRNQEQLQTYFNYRRISLLSTSSTSSKVFERYLCFAICDRIELVF